MLLYTTLFNKTDIISDYLGEQIPNFLDKTFDIPSQGFNFKVFTVTEEYIARPDLISYDAYGDSMYADIICKINGISNPFELNTGMTLLIPALESINNFTGRPSSVEDSSSVDGDLVVPVAKKPGEKRKANDAVVNDERFKVDAASGIIIY